MVAINEQILPAPVLAQPELAPCSSRQESPAMNGEAREGTAGNETHIIKNGNSRGGQKLSRKGFYTQFDLRNGRLRAAMEFADQRSKLRANELADRAAAELAKPSARHKFKTLLSTIDNRSSGVDAHDIPLWHYDFIKGVERNWLKFWARRGMTPPPVSHHIVHIMDGDEQGYGHNGKFGARMLTV